MTSPIKPDSLRANLRQAILDQLTDALLDPIAMNSLSNPVLRVEAFLQDGDLAIPGQSDTNPVVSRMVDLSGYLSPTAQTPVTGVQFPVDHSVLSQAHFVQHGDPTIQGPPMQEAPPTSPMTTMSAMSTITPIPSEMPLHQKTTHPAPTDDTDEAPHYFDADDSNDGSARRDTSGLRPARARPGDDVQYSPDSQRQMQIAGHFPKRAKVQSDPVVFVPQQSSMDKFIVSIWDQIHGSINFDPQSLLEQWQLMASAATATTNSAVERVDAPPGEPLSQQQQEQLLNLELGLISPLSFPIASNNSSPMASGGGGNGIGGEFVDGGGSDADTTRATATSSSSELNATTFNRSNLFCRKVTQASRACRSIEVIVQARWIELFDSHVGLLSVLHPSMSPTKRRKAALMEACADFGWAEKELRNKMAIWRGYKEIKDAAGWAALVFAGMGLYRFCKYRVGFTTESMARLRALRSRLEVAADTLHPTWRQLLIIVGESPGRRFSGNPHDWVVRRDGSDPVPLRSTYLDSDPYFSFEHLESGCVLDPAAWAPDDDPRWVPPIGIHAAACAVSAAHACHACGQEQSDDPKTNNCYCFPTLFGPGVSSSGGPGSGGGGDGSGDTSAGALTGNTGPRNRRAACPVQVFRTTDGRNNGLLALSPFKRGAAIGEFLGLVTRGLRDTDVMDASTGLRGYQVWQGQQGNFTRFVNHSCNPNAQFQNFVWMGLQRIVLVSKGIEAGQEITVDYSASYWRGLDKGCLCGESCCRYRRRRGG